MNGVQLHLMFNHLPVGGAVFGAALLAAGLAFSRESLRRAALAVLILAAVTAPPAFLSGEPAEEIAEGLTGVSETMIEEHEESAGFALAVILLSGAAAAVCLFLIKRKGAAPKGFYSAVLLLALLAVAALGRTAHLGGLIRHPEIQQAAN